MPGNVFTSKKLVALLSRNEIKIGNVIGHYVNLIPIVRSNFKVLPCVRDLSGGGLQIYYMWVMSFIKKKLFNIVDISIIWHTLKTK